MVVQNDVLEQGWMTDGAVTALLSASGQNIISSFLRPGPSLDVRLDRQLGERRAWHGFHGDLCTTSNAKMSVCAH